MQFGGVLERLPLFLGGTLQTLWLSTAAFALALLIGLGLALARLSRRRTLSLGSRMITDLVRGIPALVLVLLIYFGLPQVGFDLGSGLAGIIALGLNSGAYVGEAFRAGIQAVDLGQTEAARSLGMSPAQTLTKLHAPLLARSLVTAGLLVFVDVMKELPATLAMRPFNFDTLAVQTYHLAKDERLAEASVVALAIVIVGLIPVLLLARSLRR